MNGPQWTKLWYDPFEERRTMHPENCCILANSTKPFLDDFRLLCQCCVRHMSNIVKNLETRKKNLKKVCNRCHIA
jgi:hypothetical protein